MNTCDIQQRPMSPEVGIDCNSERPISSQTKKKPLCNIKHLLLIKQIHNAHGPPSSPEQENKTKLSSVLSLLSKLKQLHARFNLILQIDFIIDFTIMDTRAWRVQ